MGKRSNFRTTITSCLLSVLVALSGAISPAQANASVPTDGEYVCTTGELLAGGDTSPTYTISNGVVSYADDCAGAVTIASGVTEIVESAFEDASGMTSVSIPASVTAIGPCDMAATSITVDSANPNYSSIDGVLFNKARTSLVAYPTANEEISYSIPSSVTTIPYCAFYKTKFLKSINIPNSVTSIGEWAFADMRNVETVTFAPNSPITRVEAFTFTGLVKLNSITLPPNLEFIGDHAFDNTTSLTSITIPEGVTSIGDYAFRNASALTFIIIPAAVTSIGNSFEGAALLAAIYVDPNNQTYRSIDGVLFNGGATTLLKYPSGKTETSYTIPASVTSIENSAFQYAGSLMDVNFSGDAPTNVGTDAFSNTASGAKANISATATGFGTDATWNGLIVVRAVPANGDYVCTTGVLRTGDDTSPTYIINNGVVESGGSCVGAVVIPEGVTSIGYGAFAEQSVLTVITIPASVTSIENSAFQYAGSLMDVNFSGDAPTNVGTDAFSNTASGAKANISATATGFGTDATWNGLIVVRAVPANGDYVCTTGLLRTGNDPSPVYTITAGVVTSGGACTGSVVVPAGVTSIGQQGFYNASALTSISLPDGITRIGLNAFNGATALTSISIPASVTTIDGYAFFGATALASLTIPASVTSFGAGALQGTDALTSITVDSGNPSFTSIAGVLFDKNATTVIHYPSGKGLNTYSIPEGVTSIGSSAFQGEPSLTSITIPEGVTSIGSRAFLNAKALTSITVPASVTSIGDYVFYGSTTLKNVYFQGNAPTLGSQTFGNITSGAKVVISATATGFSTDATWNGLEIVRAVPVPTNGQYVCTTGVLRTGDDTSPTYTITAGVVESGGSCVGAVLIPAGVTAIGESAFEGATALTSISIPASVTSIGERGLRGVGLTSITFAQGGQLATIGEFAFSFATSLTTITIPAGVTSIGSGAFYKATSLNSINIPSSVTSIGEDAFQVITPLAQINVDPNNQTYSSIDGVLFNEGATTLIQYATGKTEIAYNVPASVTSISGGAFYGADALTSITIPASVTTIEDYVFEDTDALIDINFLGNAPTDVDEDAFADMSSGAKAHIKASATGFGAPSAPWIWNGLFVQADLKEVTYNSAGGTPVTPSLFTQSGSIQTAPVSTRADYTLAGWSVTDNGSVVTFPYTPTADITLHAIWTSTATPPSPQAPLANLTKMAEEARARAVLAAQAEIRSTLISGKPLTADQLLSADFKGVTSKNIGLVNADMAKLSEADKTDLKQIEKVVLKFAIVDKFAEGKTVYSSDLIAAGLIPQDSKIKTSITSALKKLPGSSLDTFEKIQAAVASVEKKHADRKARLAAVLGKKR